MDHASGYITGNCLKAICVLITVIIVFFVKKRLPSHNFKIICGYEKNLLCCGIDNHDVNVM